MAASSVATRPGMQAMQPSFWGEALPKIHTVGLSIPPPKNTYGGGAPFPIPTYGHLPIPYLGEAAYLGTDQFPKTQAPKISIFKIQKLKNGQLTLGAQNFQKWATDPKWAQIGGCKLHARPYLFEFWARGLGNLSVPR